MANFDDLFTTPAAPESPSAPPQLTKEEYAAKKKAERDDLYALADEMAHEIMQDGDAFQMPKRPNPSSISQDQLGKADFLDPDRHDLRAKRRGDLLCAEANA